MPKKPKPITVNKAQSATYSMDKDAKTYSFGPKFVSESATTTVGIDTADAVTKTKISFNGKINLTGTDATKTYVGMDIDVTTDSSITIGKKASVAATTIGIDASAKGGVLTITNGNTVTGTNGSGIVANNDSGLAGSVVINNNKSITGGENGVKINSDGAVINNAAGATISATKNTAAVVGPPAVAAKGAAIYLTDANTDNDWETGEKAIVVNNKGTISVAVGDAIKATDEVTVQINNEGTITGNVSLGDGNDELSSSGAITGVVSMGAGNDTVTITKAHAAADIVLGAGDDWYFGAATGASVKSLAGGDGNDTFVFGATIAQVTEVAMTGGNDTVVAGAAIDLATDTKLANIENARLTGSTDLNVTGNAVANILYGNGGKNVIKGNDGDDTIEARAGDDTLEGGAGGDMLKGEAGNDKIEGGDGADMIYGGAGDDTLTGNVATTAADADMDTFVFAAGFGKDTITDFEDGVDFINLAPLGIKDIAAAADADSVTVTASGTDTLITLDANNTILLKGVAVANVTVADFLFA